MVHYVRFLSPPQVSETQKKLLTVSAVLVVTTDLGDAFFAEDVDLQVRIVRAQKNLDVIHEQTVFWKGQSRALKVSFQCPGKYAGQSVRMHAAAPRLETSGSVPMILDVWSMPFELTDKQRAEPLVGRELLLHNNTNLKIREEIGDSIARHVWDASLGFLLYLEQTTAKSSQDSKARALIHGSIRKPIKVLELGSGCGTVGIAFAQTYNCDMLLTDLDDATDILRTNIKLASIKSRSTLTMEVLDWSSDLHDSLNVKYDLVILSDCIYNPDSSVHLVETLQRLAKSSPQTLVLVGFKRRHYADDTFFDHMKAAKFETLETETITLPHVASDYDATLPTIEFYTYRPPA